MANLNAVFSLVDNRGRVDAVITRFGNAIALGLLPDGEKLPSETDLAERLGVSTVSIREALNVLRERGLVETRRGRNGGSFVRTPGQPGAEEMDARLMALDPYQLRDYTDLHMGTLAGAAFLAARRATPEGLACLRRTLAEMEAARTPEESRVLGGRFGIEIASMSGSDRFADKEIAMQADLGRPMADLLHRLAPAELIVAWHREVYEAIAAGDAEGARRFVADSLRRALEYLLEIRLGER